MLWLVGGIELHPCGRIWLWHCFPSTLDVLSCTLILELFVMEGKGFLWTQLLDLILPPSPKTQYTISAAGNSTRRAKICKCAYLWGNISFWSLQAFFNRAKSFIVFLVTQKILANLSFMLLRFRLSMFVFKQNPLL